MTAQPAQPVDPSAHPAAVLLRQRHYRRAFVRGLRGHQRRGEALHRFSWPSRMGEGLVQQSGDEFANGVPSATDRCLTCSQSPSSSQTRVDLWLTIPPMPSLPLWTCSGHGAPPLPVGASVTDSQPGHSRNARVQDRGGGVEWSPRLETGAICASISLPAIAARASLSATHRRTAALAPHYAQSALAGSDRRQLLDTCLRPRHHTCSSLP